MRITLQIENVDRLETGGQVSYSCADRGFDIGRHEHLDWSLPDPQRVISGKHCEVRFEGGQFVLYDVSTNGTFLNGSPNRMDKAHALRSGDRLMIGDYIVAVTLDAGEGAGAGFSGAAPSGADPAYQPHTAPWQSPAQAPAAPAEPQWPSAQPSATPPYPAQEAHSPWGAPASTGMEGRRLTRPVSERRRTMSGASRATAGAVPTRRSTIRNPGSRKPNRRGLRRRIRLITLPRSHTCSRKKHPFNRRPDLSIR